MDFPIGLEPLENFLLVSVGLYVEEEGGFFLATGTCSLLLEGNAELLPRGFGVGDKFGVVPIGFEGCAHLRPEVGRFVLADLDVPFQAIRQGGLGDVGGTDIGDAETGFTVDDVRLGVKPGTPRVVGNF